MHIIRRCQCGREEEWSAFLLLYVCVCLTGGGVFIYFIYVFEGKIGR